VIIRNPQASSSVIRKNTNYIPPVIDLEADEIRGDPQTQRSTAAERSPDLCQPSTSNSVQSSPVKKRKAENQPCFDQPDVKKSKCRVRPIEAAFRNRASTFKIRNLKKCVDPSDFLVSIYKKVKDVQKRF
jgi:hypothetical protein